MFYETEADRIAMARVLTAYCDALSFTYRLTPPGHPWDADVRRGASPTALAEVKLRHIPRTAFATYKVDRTKIDTLIAAAEAQARAALLIVQFTDVLVRLVLCAEWLDQHAVVSMLARTDRGDPHDTDVVYEWSNDLWVPVGDGYIEGPTWPY